MAPIGVAGGVGVVLEQEHLAPDTLLPQTLLGAADEAFEDALTRLVVDDEIVDRVALGRCVLGVAADVEVEPGAVLEEHVARATPGHDPPEQIARDLVGAQTPLPAKRAGDPVLVLETEDSTLHTRSVLALGWLLGPVRRTAVGSCGGAHAAIDLGQRVVLGARAQCAFALRGHRRRAARPGRRAVRAHRGRPRPRRHLRARRSDGRRPARRARGRGRRHPGSTERVERREKDP